METIRILHIIAGILIAISGLLQILMKKGGQIHRITGTIYFLAWPVIVVTGGFLGSFLITMLGALGLYMAYTGYRFGRLKSVKINIVDKVIILLGLLTSLGIGIGGIYLLVRNNIIFGCILLFFGVIFFTTCFKDLNSFVFGKINRKMSGHPMEWFFEHYGRMYISYIAAMTAFTVIQNPFPFFEILNWILPTIIGTAIIIFTTKYYKKNYNIDVVSRD